MVKNDKQVSGKSKKIAMLLSFCFTGAGHLYLGATERGVIQLVIYFILASLSAATGIFFIFWIPYWIWGMDDAANKADEVAAALNKQKIAELEAATQQENIRASTITSIEFVAQIDKYFKLFKSDLLSEMEFEEKKTEALNMLVTKKITEAPEDFLTAIIPLIQKKALAQQEILQIKTAVFIA